MRDERTLRKRRSKANVGFTNSTEISSFQNISFTFVYSTFALWILNFTMSTSRDGRALAKRPVWLTSAIIAASIGLLPRITSSASVQVYSVDRPEHPLLTPITSGPVNATSWNLIGTLMGLLVLAVSQEGWSFRRLLDATIAHAISTACIFPIIVCFGGPLNMSTAILSAQIGALTIFPAIYILGLPSLDSNGVAARYRLTRLLCEFR